MFWFTKHDSRTISTVSELTSSKLLQAVLERTSEMLGILRQEFHIMVLTASHLCFRGDCLFSVYVFG